MSDMEAAEMTSELALSLHSELVSSATKAAEVRGAVGARMKALGETHGLNLRAFKMASTIRKMENGKREHFIRDLMHLMELLQCNQQKDILDSIADANAGRVRTDLEARLDGQPREAAADSTGKPTEPETEARVNAPLKPGSPMGRHHLNAFSETVREATDRDAITKGLENFATDHPKLAEEAGIIARDRLAKLGAEQGGGEDLRPKHLREGEAAAADQAAQTGKRTGRARKSKAAEAASPAVH